jgi:hypothetical protein
VLNTTAVSVCRAARSQAVPTCRRRARGAGRQGRCGWWRAVGPAGGAAAY